MHCAIQRRILSPTHLSNQLNLNIGLLTMNISGQSINVRIVIEDALEEKLLSPPRGLLTWSFLTFQPIKCYYLCKCDII